MFAGAGIAKNHPWRLSHESRESRYRRHWRDLHPRAALEKEERRDARLASGSNAHCDATPTIVRASANVSCCQLGKSKREISTHQNGRAPRVSYGLGAAHLEHDTIVAQNRPARACQGVHQRGLALPTVAGEQDRATRWIDRAGSVHEIPAARTQSHDGPGT